MTSRLLNELDLQIITNEINSVTIASLSANERYNYQIDLYSEIKLLTGAVLYNAGKDLDMQMRVLDIFITTSPRYMRLTTAEMRHAFYLNSQGELDQIYKHYNMPLNGEFIGQVLSAYLKKKAGIYAKMPDVLELIQPKVKVEVPKVTEADYRQMIQQDYDLYRAGEFDMIFNTSAKYIYLRKRGLIVFTDKNNWIKWYNKGLEERFRIVRSSIPTDRGQKYLRNELKKVYDQIEKEQLIPRPEHHAVVHLARKMMYLRFFEVIGDCAINNIFSEIKIER